MRLNHLNLVTDDVEACAAFLQRSFGLEPLGRQGRMVFLRDEAGMVLALSEAESVSYPRLFHIGFIQPDRAAVDRINGAMAADGVRVKPPVEAHGYTFYVDAPGGIRIEVLC